MAKESTLRGGLLTQLRIFTRRQTLIRWSAYSSAECLPATTMPANRSWWNLRPETRNLCHCTTQLSIMWKIPTYSWYFTILRCTRNILSPFVVLDSLQYHLLSRLIVRLFNRYSTYAYRDSIHDHLYSNAINAATTTVICIIQLKADYSVAACTVHKGRVQFNSTVHKA